MKTLFCALKLALVDWKHRMQLCYFKAKWRSANSLNLTFPGNVFPLGKVSVGEGTYGTLNIISYDNPDERLEIGRYCSIAGSSFFLLSGQHRMDVLSTYPFNKIMGNGEVESGCKGPIIVRDDVWIGYRALILSGVTIGQGAVVAAGAVVTKDVKPYTVVGGVPAHEIGRRFDESICKMLEKIDYSQIDHRFITEKMDNFYIPINSMIDVDRFPQKEDFCK